MEAKRLRSDFQMETSAQCLWKGDRNVLIGKDHTSFMLCIELWRAHDELGELLSVEYRLMEIVEEAYPQAVEKRGIDPGHEVLQIFVDPLELPRSESGEESACLRKWTSGFPARATSKGFENKGEIFEPGRHGEASGHRLG